MDSSVKPFSVTISTIAHATENLAKVSEAVRNLLRPANSMHTTTRRVKGHHGNEIVTLASFISDPRTAESILQAIWTLLPDLDRTEVLVSLPARIDGNGTLFLRVDKQEALKGKVRLQETDPVKISISFRTRPSRRGGSVDDVRKLLDSI